VLGNNLKPSSSTPASDASVCGKVRVELNHHMTMFSVRIGCWPRCPRAVRAAGFKNLTRSCSTNPAVRWVRIRIQRVSTPLRRRNHRLSPLATPYEDESELWVLPCNRLRPSAHPQHILEPTLFKGVKQENHDQHTRSLGHSDGKTIVADIKSFCVYRHRRDVDLHHHGDAQRSLLQGARTPGIQSDRHSRLSRSRSVKNTRGDRQPTAASAISPPGTTPSARTRPHENSSRPGRLHHNPKARGPTNAMEATSSSFECWSAVEKVKFGRRRHVIDSPRASIREPDRRALPSAKFQEPNQSLTSRCSVRIKSPRPVRGVRGGKTVRAPPCRSNPTYCRTLARA